MAKVQNTFVKSKMNQDLDARLLPNGEYRSAKNAQISKSESAQVGNLENSLGNSPVILDPITGNTSIKTLTGVSGLKCIGNFADEFNNVVYLFFTDYTDTDTDANNYSTTASNFIISYDVLESKANILVKGNFLNFSTTNLITGINVLEDLLFFTDNRNQPRVINTTLANPNFLSNPTYYTTEDQISVAKFNPFKSMELYEKSVLAPTEYETTMKDVSSLFMPDGGSAIADGNTTGTTIPIVDGSIVGQVNEGSIYSGASVSLLDMQLNVLTPTGATVTTPLSSTAITVDIPITVENLQKIVFNPNPYYDYTFSGDPEYLESKFVRFSYRFKFVDNEYSLFAPFTQTAFIPKQDGYFMATESPNVARDDQKEAYQSSIVYFVENKVNSIGLRIPLPFSNYTIESALKLKEIDILYKESDAVAVKLVETIPINDIKESSAIAIIDGTQTPGAAGANIAIKDIQGGIKVGEVISGSGFPIGTTVTSFVPTDPVNPISGNIQVDKTISDLTDGVSVVIGDINFFTYNYNSTKPTRTLPESELVRVFDKIPVKALAQEVSGNRVMYGNFLNKIDPPASLDYNVISTPKAFFEINEVLTTTTQAGTVAAGGTIAINLTKGTGYTPPQGLIPGMVVTSPTFGVTIPENTTVVSTTNQFQDIIITALAAPATSSTVISLINTNGSPEIGSVMSGPGIPVGPAPKVQSYNPAGGVVTLDTAVTTLANTQYTFTSAFRTTADITLNNDITLPTPATTVILIFEAGGDVSNTTSYIEYPNSSLKTNRNYQVGFVLSDRYGRTSSVLLSNNKDAITVYNQTYSGSTLYSPYIDGNTPQTQWPGNSLKVIVNSPINPGIVYNGDPNDSNYNPLGWYSYKVVVKQTEQDYYNVYLPGIMNSYPTEFKKEVGQTAHVVLINDNINKIPRNLEEVGPDQKQFGSSIQLFGRVQNTSTLIAGFNDLGEANTQYYLQKESDTVSIISTIQDLFDYDPIEPPRPNYFPQFYSLDSNPLVARITTQRPIGQLSTTNFSSDSGKSLKPINQQDLNPATGSAQVFPTPEPQKKLQVTAYTSTSGGDLNNITIEANDLVSGPGLPGEVYVKTGSIGAFAADGQPITASNPAVGVEVDLFKYKASTGTEEDFYFIPVEDGVYTFEPTDGAPDFNLDTPGIQYLAVYETAPVESLLDLYYETSTSGLISDLNQAVVNNQDVQGGLDLFPFTSTLFTEGLGRKANILNNPNSLSNGFNIVDSIGSPVTLNPANGDSILLSLVTNGLGQQCGGIAGNTVLEQEGIYFLLEDSSGAGTGPWQIRTTDDTDQFFGSFSNTANYYDNIFYMYNEGKRIFTFKFQITFNGVTTFIDKTLELGNESPLFTGIEVNNQPATTQGNPVVYGPNPGENPIPSPPSFIPVKFTRNPPLSFDFALIKGQNGANNPDLANQDVDYVGNGQSYPNVSGNGVQIYDARIGGIGSTFPEAVLPNSGCAIFKLESFYGSGSSNEIQAQLGLANPSSACGFSALQPALFYASIPAAIYYVTVRIQDADTFEDVIFKVDMRVSITGGADGNIRNMGFKTRSPFVYNDPAGMQQHPNQIPIPTGTPGYTGIKNSDQFPLTNDQVINCGFKFYGGSSNSKRSTFPSTLFQIKPTTSGSSAIDQGWYLYAGGFFDNTVGGWDGVGSEQGRVQPSRDLLNQYMGNPLPNGDYVVTIPRITPDLNGFRAQTQPVNISGISDYAPLTVAKATVSGVFYGAVYNDPSDPQGPNARYAYIDVDTNTLQFDTASNPLLSEITVGMRIYKNWPSNINLLENDLPEIKQTRNRIVGIQNVAGLPGGQYITRYYFALFADSTNTSTAGNYLSFEGGIQAGDTIFFYGGKAQNANPWFYSGYTSGNGEEALRRVVTMYMTSPYSAGYYDCATVDTSDSGFPSNYYTLNGYVNLMGGADGAHQNIPSFPSVEQINNIQFNII